MCKRTKKVLFTAGGGMLMLVFLCATKYHINRVVNGQGKGSKVEDFQNIDKSILASLKVGDVLLDNVTGDLYAYDFSVNEFMPFGNAGIHKHKAAQDNNKLRNLMLKQYVYNPKQFDHLESAYIGKLNETLCRINKRNVQHWLVKDIGLQDFLIPQNNAWDIHPISMPEADNRFQVFAETARGPQVIIHHNSVGCMFHINPKYPTTVTILKNYVEHLIKRFQKEKDRLDLPLSEVVYSILQARPVIYEPSETLYHLTAIDTAKSNTTIFARPLSGTTRPMTSGTNRPMSSSTVQINSSSFKQLLPNNNRPITASTIKLEASIHPNDAPIQKLARPKSSHSGFAVSKRHKEYATADNNATTDRPVLIQNAMIHLETPFSPTKIVPETPTRSNNKLD